MQQIGLPRGGLPRVRPFPSLLEKPPTGEGIEWGPPASFLLKAAPGREEGSLSYKWGGLLVRESSQLREGQRTRRRGPLGNEGQAEARGQSYTKSEIWG